MTGDKLTVVLSRELVTRLEQEATCMIGSKANDVAERALREFFGMLPLDPEDELLNAIMQQIPLRMGETTSARMELRQRIGAVLKKHKEEKNAG